MHIYLTTYVLIHRIKTTAALSLNLIYCAAKKIENMV